MAAAVYGQGAHECRGRRLRALIGAQRRGFSQEFET